MYSYSQTLYPYIYIYMAMSKYSLHSRSPLLFPKDIMFIKLFKQNLPTKTATATK